MSERSHADTTSAEDKSIGFDYQYYYFLNELLNLKKGLAVGLEVLDDIHIERADGTYLLVQLKHTVQTNAQGLPINLTKLDGDLWKSVSNWCKVVTDPVKKRTTVSAQLDFVTNASFLLVSNKSDNNANTFLSSVAAFKRGEKTHSELVDDISTIKSGTEDSKIQEYINIVLGLDPVVSDSFFKKLSFALGRDDLIDLCKTSIYEKQIDLSRIDDVFHVIDSEVRSSIFSTVRDRKKVIIIFEDFNRKYRRHFDKARSQGLITREIPPALPSNLLDQTFVKQLLEIEDIHKDNLRIIAKFTTRRLQFCNNLEQWFQDGDITQPDIDKLEQEAEAFWEGLFLAAYPSMRASADEAASGRMIVKELRQRILRLASTELCIIMSNGGFYELSDRPIIGWLHNWEDRYK